MAYSMGMIFICWTVFLFYCKLGFKRLLYYHGKGAGGSLTNGYHRIILRLSILAIFLFILNVYMFHLKYWLQAIPGVRQLSVLQGILALALFIFYLSTMWYFAYPAYKLVFQAEIKRRSFITSNLKLNIPILFPWLVLSFVYDIIALSPWAGPESFLGRTEGQIVFFAVFLAILMVFMPPFIQYWWDCGPFDPSNRVDELKKFLREMGFKYRDLLRWPIFEGRMMTAGIMGIVPRYRYILMTDSLMEILSIEELKAVIAHEVGHARHRHMFFYVLFFLGYIGLSLGAFDLFFKFLASQPIFMKLLEGGGARGADLFYLILSVPIILSIFVYFRYIMGFFMRNFERQADLYSAVIMGSPVPAVGALEKIALLSGKSRNIPSWHHFSIKERVDCLWRTLKDPGLVVRHNKFVRLSFFIYLLSIIGLGYYLNFSPIQETFNNRLINNMLQQQLEEDPENIILLQGLAMTYYEMGRYNEARDIYERVLLLDESQPTVLNNLAWLLVTAPDMELRDPRRALALAEKAVALERSPMFLDTLAEALYANGSIEKAIEIISEAISLEKEDDRYYKKQLEKFIAAREEP